jgi:hypothetical protein
MLASKNNLKNLRARRAKSISRLPIYNIAMLIPPAWRLAAILIMAIKERRVRAPVRAPGLQLLPQNRRL